MDVRRDAWRCLGQSVSLFDSAPGARGELLSKINGERRSTRHHPGHRTHAGDGAVVGKNSSQHSRCHRQVGDLLFGYHVREAIESVHDHQSSTGHQSAAQHCVEPEDMEERDQGQQDVIGLQNLKGA